MGSFLTTLILNGVRQLPALVAEVEQAIKDAETPEAASAKVKALVEDVVKVLTTLGEML